MPPRVLAIVGPTASGKTALAAELALRLSGEVVSVDSMQVYRRMDIGTAKPTREEMRGVPHHMIDVADPEEDYSAARYVLEAGQAVDDILARGKLPILAGGTGLYLDSLLRGRTFAGRSPGVREALAARVRAEGTEALLSELARVDPETAARLHPRDEKRILRALEVYLETGKTLSQHDRESRALPPRYEAVTLGLAFADRRDLWARIDARVDKMMAAGLPDEVRALLQSGVPDTCTSMQAIGYKELAAALRTGGDLSAAAAEVKLRSRQYAKRQLTWFRRDGAVHWYLWPSSPDFADCVQNSTQTISECGL